MTQYIDGITQGHAMAQHVDDMTQRMTGINAYLQALP